MRPACHGPSAADVSLFLYAGSFQAEKLVYAHELTVPRRDRAPAHPLPGALNHLVSDSAASSALARSVTVARTRPAAARSCAGRSPQIRALTRPVSAVTAA